LAIEHVASRRGREKHKSISIYTNLAGEGKKRKKKKEKKRAMTKERKKKQEKTYLGLKLALSSSFFKCTKLGNSKIMFLPSSMMGLWQKEQRTLQGSLCAIDLLLGSYHSRSWCPLTKLISSLWKMAAHWKGAAVRKRRRIFRQSKYPLCSF
jgi:hypothetical protein